MEQDSEALISWRTEGLKDSNGILIASDHALESWIPWWFSNYSKHNNFPVTVADLGMSIEMKQWCEERWEVVPIKISFDILKNRLPLIQTRMTKRSSKRPLKRYCWFRKPLALLQSPYKKTIWMDLDCLVLGKLDELFEWADNPYGLALGEDNRLKKIQAKMRAGILQPGENHINTGVMPYLHGAQLIQKWAKSTIEEKGYYLGDQDILMHLLSELKIHPPVYPKKYNWIVPESGINREAIVLHFIEEAKEMAENLVEDYNQKVKK